MSEPIKAIQMTAECQIVAAANDEGKPAKLPTFSMLAYSGGVMNVQYHGPVVVDLAGMEMSDTTPIYYGHAGSYNIDAILGQTGKVEVKDGNLMAYGTIMGESEIVEKVMTLARNGFRFQASLGADPRKVSMIDDDIEVEVNGQTLRGPFTLVSASKLNEISIVPLGADQTTESRIAAQKTVHNQQENTMDPKDQKTAEAIRAEAVAEQSRINEVREVTKSHPDIQAKAMTEGWDKQRAEIAVKDAIIAEQAKQIEAKKVQDDRPEGKIIGFRGVQAKNLNARTIEAAVCLNQGIRNPEKAYDADTLTAAADLRIHSLTDLVRASLASEGKRLEASRHEVREFLQAAFSTRTISNILSNVANKFIMQGYGKAEAQWRRIASIRSVNDFKANTGVRLVMANLLKELAPNGEIQHATLSDETRSIQADTKALMLGITRKDIVNDDLGALTEIPRKLGFAAARTFNTDFWAALTAAVATKFPSNASLGNYTTGALSLTTLAVADALYGALRDSDGNPIGVEGSMIVTSHTNKAIAREIYTSTTLVGGTAKTGANNVFVGQYEPIITSYLSGASYFLTADPDGVPLMEAAFLNGRQEPFVETSDADFNTLGVQMRCWYDYGVSFAENKGTVYSTGG